MPLSEHEQRLLEEMERSLYQNDADFVATVGARRGKTPYRSVVLGILIAVVGIGVLITGVFLPIAVVSTIVGVVGFIVMFLGVLLAIAPGKRAGGAPDEPQQGAPASASKPAQAGFMHKLNDRWDKRQDGQG
ncbi:DUF3040 domain-containing protein [Leifsonia poae]|uniref:DUF3040 domain-containing protein n=1 Tax=Leifsonia poae TaxID=110933 RepID=UPI001CC000AA|nr:DUF3040 domain-containing protein [Leifsonia poae]